jgi:hypothetical protein
MTPGQVAEASNKLSPDAELIELVRAVVARHFGINASEVQG